MGSEENSTKFKNKSPIQKAHTFVSIFNAVVYEMSNTCCLIRWQILKKQVLGQQFKR